ncbi:MAG: methyltransferase domain-containing protein [Candidatus Nanoarchaeia archaeon]|nr:methyltransferase domain-containing protein [Candidatus Nanoarchaeia archaeon]
MNEVISLIIKKKELSGISHDVVLKEIIRNINPKLKKLIDEKRFKSGEFKKFVKNVRAQLRRQFGAFNNPNVDRLNLLRKKDYQGLLLSHQSSKERLPYYNEVYSKIFKGIKSVSIIDIGCGFNPLSSKFMKPFIRKYLALDINENDLKIIQEYFDELKINGLTKVFDATNLENYSFDEEFDICFAFKLFEILERTKSHRLTEDIILKIPAKIIAASFSTKTLSGAPMTRKRRIWFEVMSKRLGYKIETFMVPNELFYILSK